MKPLRVDFVVPNGGRLLWVGFALLAAVLLGAFAWKASKMVTTIQTTTAEMERIQSETDRLHKLSVPKTTPRSASAGKVVTLLQFDVNKMFSAMENVDVAGTRLTGVTLDMASGNLGMEYALEQSTQAQGITDALNAGYDTRPWRLSRVGSTANSSLLGGMPPQAKASASGVWNIGITKL